MQEALNSLSSTVQSDAATPSSLPQTQDNYQIIRRSGDVVPFAPQKIAIALTKAFLAVRGAQGAASASVRDAHLKPAIGTSEHIEIAFVRLHDRRHDCEP